MADIKYKPLPQLLVVSLLVLVFGLMGIFSYISALIRKGPSKLFYRKKRNVRPQVLSNNDFGSHEFMMLKNSRMKLHYVINGPKDKPLMLFLHGLPEFWYSWRHQLKEFCKEYRVCAVDMRGYGDSDKPPRICDYHPDELTSDLQQLITQLEYKKCILVSHDWGGMVSWLFTIRYLDMVDRLIVCNCPHPAALSKQLKSSFKQISMSWFMYLSQLPLIPEALLLADDLDIIDDVFVRQPFGMKQGSCSDEELAALKYNIAEKHDLVGPINYNRAYMRYDTPSWARSNMKIQCPTLMIWGTKDFALGKDMAEMSGSYVEDYTLKWVEGASHWVQQEEPGLVNGHIWEFLKRG